MKKRSRKLLAAVIMAAFGTTMMGLPAYAAEPEVHITPEQQQQYSDDSWIQEQADKEAAMEAELQSGDYTAENPYVEVDPYGNNPLAALVMFKTDKDTKVSVDIQIPADKSGAYDEESSFGFDFDEYTKEHYIPVYALFVGDNTVTLTVTDKSGNSDTYDVAITTTTPEGFVGHNAQTLTLDKGNDNIVKGLNFVSYVIGSTGNIVAYDFNGNLRAIFTNSGMGKILDMDNGHIAYEDGNTLHGIYYNTGFIEADMMGKVYQHYLVTGIHHEFIQLENGNWLIDAERPDGATTEDYFVELDEDTGMPIRDWWLKDSFGLTDYVANPYYDYNNIDWLHVNSFVQIPGEDAIIFSARQNDGLYKLNLATNEIDWVMAEDDEDYTEDFSAKRLTPVITQDDGSVITVDEWWENNKELNPTGASIDWHNPDDPYFQIENCPFEYTYGQHAVSLLPNGDIFAFDNGDGRSKDADKMITPADEEEAREIMNTADPSSQEYQDALATNYSRAVIYHYDEEAGTIEQIWEYGKDRGMELYANYICDVDYIGPDHYIIDFGGCNSGGGMMGSGSYARVIELYKDEVINEMNVATNCYRAERLDPYYGVDGEYELNEVQGVQKGELLLERVQLNDLRVKMDIGSTDYTINGEAKTTDSAPYINSDNRTMVPLRLIGEATGADVEWNGADRTVTVTDGDDTVVVTIGDSTMTVNGEDVAIDTEATIQNSRTMVPLRAISEALGCHVLYEYGAITIDK